MGNSTWLDRILTKYEYLRGDEPRRVAIPVRQLGLATGQTVIVRRDNR